MGAVQIIIFGMTAICLMALPTFGQGQQMMQPRVPADKIEEARALHNPLTPTPEILEQGKAIYEGKGTCVNCHGMTGHGDGPGAATLNPPPRVFRSHGFWRHRTEGEIFWVIKHGSPGTAMIPFSGLLSDEEIWMVMLYERSFAGGGHRGPRHGSSEMGGGHGHKKDSTCMGEHKGKRGHGMSHGKQKEGDCQSHGMNQ